LFGMKYFRSLHAGNPRSARHGRREPPCGQLPIALITFIWPGLTWPVLARRQVGLCPERNPQPPELDAP
jgi:hypothetical protein